MQLKMNNGETVTLREGPAWVRPGAITDAAGITHRFDRDGKFDGAQFDGTVREEKSTATAPAK